MVRRLGHDYSARLPLELKLDGLSRLSGDDLLRASSVSRIWRAAGRLDPRFIVHVCACTRKRKSGIIARRNGRPVPIDNFEYARRLKLLVALTYDTSGRTTNCGCTKPKRLISKDWQAFSGYFQPIADRLVQLQVVTGSSMPRGGLFDLVLPVLRDLRLEAKRCKQARPPSTVPSKLFICGASALRTVHLRDLALCDAVPAFRQVTTLTFEFTDRCTGLDVLVPLDSFTSLRDIAIVGSMDHVSEVPVNWFSKMAWAPTVDAHLRSPSLIESPGRAWDGPSITLPPITSLRYDDLPDAWTEHADSFLRTIVPLEDEPLHVMIFTRDLRGLVVAQRTESTSLAKTILRVLSMPDPQQINYDSDQGLHEPLFPYLTVLTIQLDPFVRYDIPDFWARGRNASAITLRIVHYQPFLRAWS